MKLALCQMSMSPDPQENLQKSLDAIRTASHENADLIVFPELQFYLFFPQYEKLDTSSYAMPINHVYIQQMRAACRENHIMAAPNIFLREKGCNYDATLLIGQNGAILGIQKMVHIAQAEGFYEQDYYAPSDDGFHVFETEFGKLGIVVCFDRHYPESIRTEVLMGADFILIPTANTAAEPSEMFEWEVRIQAFQNSVAIAMCNRVGIEGRMEFSGESILVDAEGRIITKANADEEIIYADIAPEESHKIRESKPYTNLRRTDFYR